MKLRVVLTSSIVFAWIIYIVLIVFKPFSAPAVLTSFFPEIIGVPSQQPSASVETQGLSLDAIFNTDHRRISEFPPERIRTLIASGDVIPARSVNAGAARRKSFTWPFEKTAARLKTADITFINLETPLIADCAPTVEGMIFCGSNEHIQGLQFAGIDVVSIANNHAGNHGLVGIYETVGALERAGFTVTGHTNPAYVKVRGLTFAFLGYNDIGAPEAGIAWAQAEQIKTEIAVARKKADVVIVTYHWGVEYVTQPSERQKELARLSITAGADLVIGNHPHRIQPIEIYNGKLITYAHGNFIFDQEWSQKTKEGVVGKYTFFDKQLIDVEYLPVEIADYGQPYFLEGERKQHVLDEMKRASEELAGND